MIEAGLFAFGSVGSLFSNLPGTVEAQLRPVVLGKLRNGSLLPYYGAFFREDLADPESYCPHSTSLHPSPALLDCSFQAAGSQSQFGLYLLNLGSSETDNVPIRHIV